MGELEFTSGPIAGRSVEVEAELILGRVEGDLIVADDEVSGRHALLRPTEDGGIEITDLDSSNGTWVDGVRISSTTRLGDGSLLKVGSSEARAKLPPPPQATKVAEPVAAPAPTQAHTPPPAPEPAPPSPAPPAQPAPQAPVATPAAAAAPRGPAATRLRGPELLTYAIVLLTAAALIVYFAAR